MAAGTIVVVEDNLQNMKLVKDMLTPFGYRVIECPDAETGFSAVKRERPDLILMDIQLPGMDGLQAVRLLKDDPETRDIPVMAITSFAMAGDRERILGAGCDAYFAKPLRMRDFLARVKSALDTACGDTTA